MSASANNVAKSVASGSKQHEQVIIRPGETFHYACEANIRRPGPFKGEITVYLEDHGIRAATITVKGDAVAPEANSHAKPTKP